MGNSHVKAAQVASPRVRGSTGVENGKPKKLKKSMSMRDSLTLSPFQKWRQYGRPPWKFILRCLLLITVTTQILVLSTQFTVYARSGHNTFQGLLLPDVPENPVDFERTLYTISDTIGAVNTAVNAYYDFSNITVGYYERVSLKNGTKSPVNMTVHEHQQHPPGDPNLKNFKQFYELTPDDLGPFNDIETARHFLHTVRSFELSFRFEGYEVGGYGGPMLFFWQVTIRFDLQRGGGELLVKYKDLPELQSQYHKFVQTILPNFIITSLAGLSILLNVKALLMAFRRLMKAKSVTVQGKKVKWETLPWLTKIKFFNMWNIMAILADTLVVISSALFLTFVFSSNGLLGSFHAALVFVGLGMLFSWVSFMQFLEFNEKLNVLITTLRSAAPRVSRFVISVSPLFIGYTITGVAMFSTCSERFETAPASAYTLFSVLNGDEIRATFLSLNRCPYPALGQTFVYTFTVLFMSTIFNVFIFLVEDSYHAAKGEDVETGDHGGHGGHEHDEGDEAMDHWQAILEHLDLHHREKNPNHESGKKHKKGRSHGHSRSISRHLSDTIVDGDDTDAEEGEDHGAKLEGGYHGHDHDDGHGHHHGLHTRSRSQTSQKRLTPVLDLGFSSINSHADEHAHAPPTPRSGKGKGIWSRGSQGGEKLQEPLLDNIYGTIESNLGTLDDQLNTIDSNLETLPSIAPDHLRQQALRDFLEELHRSHQQHVNTMMLQLQDRHLDLVAEALARYNNTRGRAHSK